MKLLEEMTKKQVIELGNLAFRKTVLGHSGKYDRTEPYYSKNWKLHLFLNDKGGCTRIAIVDEKEPLMHIDDLWGKRPFREMHTASIWTPSTKYNWIEITQNDLVISQYYVTDLSCLLTKSSQCYLFWWLYQNGFLGD